MASSSNPETRTNAIENIGSTTAMSTMRTIIGRPNNFLIAALGTAEAVPGLFRQIYTLNNSEPSPLNLPGFMVRSEGQPPTLDPATDEAYDGSGLTYDFYSNVFGRNSLDDAGVKLTSTVHAGDAYKNAQWNGVQMIYGDGDGRVFNRFTVSLDVIAHELTHGVVSFESALEYQGQSGALNEHFADAFGSMIKQWANNETVDNADWLIGREILTPAATRVALRSMSAPGTAFQNDPDIGTDPQPSHMANFYTGSYDHFGVHINSGIPNHAFYLAATAVGGKSWGPVGEVWYRAMRALHRTSQFAEMAAVTRSIAQSTQVSSVAAAIDNAWAQVGL